MYLASVMDWKLMHEAVRELDHAAEWNLILKKGTLICKEKIQEIKLHSYKYPLHLEIEAKEALMNKDLKRFKEIFSGIRHIAGNFHVHHRRQRKDVHISHWS